MDGSGFGNPERGWNDPPKLAFTGAGGGRHRLLNKRVPIPINHQSTRPNTAPSSLPPTLKATDSPPIKSGIPTHPPHVCPPTTTTTTTTTNTSHPNSDGVDNTNATKDMLQQVQTHLANSLKELEEKLQESTRDEIRKRLDVMMEMWQKEQLCAEVQNRMMTLTEALSQQNYDKAWAIHQSLIVDYTTTCSPWMVGIKTLIAESRGYSLTPRDQDKPDDTEESKVQDHEKEESSSSK